jgi:hypothetical protein
MIQITNWLKTTGIGSGIGGDHLRRLCGVSMMSNNRQGFPGPQTWAFLRVLGVGDAGREMPQQLVDKTRFMLETSQQRQIDVLRHSRLTPALQSQAANETELPMLSATKCLNLLGQVKETNHLASLLNQRCCSTSPEVGRGWRWMRHDSNASARFISDCWVSI